MDYCYVAHGADNSDVDDERTDVHGLWYGKEGCVDDKRTDVHGLWYRKEGCVFTFNSLGRIAT